jgi:hypothetical protein
VCDHSCIVVYCYVFLLLLHWTVADDWRLKFAAGWAKGRHSFFLHMTCFWIRIRHWGTVHAVLFVGWMSYLKSASPFLLNLLKRGNWSAEDDGHPRTPCSLQPPCFVTIESECSSTLDAFRDLNENYSNAFRDIYWRPPSLLCHVSRSVTNSDGLRQVPARAVTSARKASSKKMSQSFLNGHEGRVF